MVVGEAAWKSLGQSLFFAGVLKRITQEQIILMITLISLFGGDLDEEKINYPIPNAGKRKGSL